MSQVLTEVILRPTWCRIQGLLTLGRINDESVNCCGKIDRIAKRRGLEVLESLLGLVDHVEARSLNGKAISGCECVVAKKIRADEVQRGREMLGRFYEFCVVMFSFVSISTLMYFGKQLTQHYGVNRDCYLGGARPLCRRLFRSATGLMLFFY